MNFRICLGCLLCLSGCGDPTDSPGERTVFDGGGGASPDARLGGVFDQPPSDVGGADAGPAEATDARPTEPLDARPGPPHDARVPDARGGDATLPGPPDADPAESGLLSDAAPSPPAARVVINEIGCHGPEFVELLNLEAAPVDLAGWTLTDDPTDAAHLFTFGADVSLDTGAFLAVAHLPFGINCGDDTLTLRAPSLAVGDRVPVPDVPDGTAWGRLPDGGEVFAATTPTPGAPNAPAVPPGGTLFDPWRLSTFDLTLDAEAVRQLTSVDPRVTVAGSLRVTTDEGPGPELVVGVRLKGRGTFRPLPDKSGFKIDLAFVEPDQRLSGLKNLTLNNLVQDPSMMREWGTYAVFRAAGLPAPRLGYAWVRVNGEDYGLYAHVETYDRTFAAWHFPSTQHVFEGGYGEDLDAYTLAQVDVDVGPKDDVSDFAAAVAYLDATPITEVVAGSDALFDWAEIAAVMATEVYVGHWDGYVPTRNNWFLHSDADGRLSLMPWGTDQTLTDDWRLHDGEGRLMLACMADAGCRALYDAHLAALIAVMDALDLESEMTALATLLRPAIEADPKRPYGLDEVDAGLAESLAFLRARRAAVGEAQVCLQAPDADGDGFRCEADCAPDDPTIHVHAREICGDGIDQDCNGLPDDGLDCPDCVPRFLGSHRYLVCPTARTYVQAIDHCVANGAGPLQIGGAGENSALHAMALDVFRQFYWVGLDDLQVEGEYRWASSLLAMPVFWEDGQPNEGGRGEDCASFLLDRATWDDRDCGRALGVLCEDPCAPGEDADGDGALRCGTDCDDDDPLTAPGRPEICGDDRDQDCDGQVDQGEGCDCSEATFGGHAYTFCARPLPHDAAVAACIGRGQRPLRLDDEAEAAWIYGRAVARSNQRWWLGLTDLAEEGRFVWADGSPPAFTAWSPGEPNDFRPGEDCAVLDPSEGDWSDQPCDRPAGVLCEGD